MSASSKKKLRAAERAEQLTERQLAEQKEAKKLKAFSIVMVAVVLLMVAFAAYTAVSNFITGSGMVQRNTVAVTVGDHEVNAVEYNCFYVDAVSNFYNQVGSYAALYGLDVTQPLDQQVVDEEAGTTWADEFKTSAEENIKSVYSICDEAAANGFTLSEDDQAYIDSQINSLTVNAVTYGYASANDYLAAMYGPGADEETVRGYFELCYTAQMYQQSVADAIEYTDAQLQARDDEDPDAFSNFSYHSYYLNSSKFLEGGTTDSEGNTTYSDEEKAAAVAAAEEAAKSLTAETITSVETLDAAIAALPINAESESAASTPCIDYSETYITSFFHDWVTDASRKTGDLTYIASTTTAEDGTVTTNGYYVVYFLDRDDNQVPLQNVRHILAAFEGGTTDDSGSTTYSDEEKAAAKAEAEAILAEWKNGEATEDSFAALANEKSDDGDGTTGGLYTDIYPGQMVTAFNDWCFDAARTAGETGIVETEYGYHVMYYVSATDYTYREYMVENTLLSEDVQAWHDALVEDVTVTVKNYSYVLTDLVISPNSSY